MKVYVVLIGNFNEVSGFISDIFDSKEKAVSYLESLDWKPDPLGFEEDDDWVDGYIYSDDHRKFYYDYAEIREWEVK